MAHFKNCTTLLKRVQFWVALGIVPLLSSCASNPSAPNEAYLQRVARYPASSDGTNLETRGFLVAYTPEELHYDEKGGRFYRHSGYYICGRKCDDPRYCSYVPNHVGKTDEAATLVNLPAGAYWIKTQTAWGEPIVVCIVIRPAVVTTINLEEDRRPPEPLVGELYRVCLNGRKVGWVTDTPTTWPVDHFVVGFPWPGI